MIEENRAKFLTVSLCFPLEQGLPQGYKGLIVISLGRDTVRHQIASFDQSSVVNEFCYYLMRASVFQQEFTIKAICGLVAASVLQFYCYLMHFQLKNLFRLIEK